MNPETKRQRFNPLIIAPAVVIPIVSGMQQWHEDPAHDLGYLVARFLTCWLLAAGIGATAGVLTVRYLVRK
jgi:hypothetical protein